MGSGQKRKERKMKEDTIKDIINDAPEMNRGRRMVGVVGNKTTVLCYYFLDNLDIQVTVREIGTGKWEVVGKNRDDLRIIATVFGGRMAAKTYAKFIRNGMVSRAKRLRGNKNRRKAESAAVAADAAEAAEATGTEVE